MKKKPRYLTPSYTRATIIPLNSRLAHERKTHLYLVYDIVVEGWEKCKYYSQPNLTLVETLILSVFVRIKRYLVCKAFSIAHR